MNTETIYKEVILKEGHVLQIFQDTWAESPRSWDNLGTMVVFHRKYNFGDEAPFSDKDFEGWAKMEEHINEELHAVVCLPIYMYDHSGITINTQGFSCPWDSGQIGFIYVTEDKVKENFGVTKIHSDDIERAKKSLEAEIKTMDQYVSGDVYGFQLIKRVNKNNVIDEVIIDSCSGFYGSDEEQNGILDHIPEELIIHKK